MDPASGGFDRRLAAAQDVALVTGLIARTLGPAGRPALVRDQAGRDTEAPDAETIAACFPGRLGGRPGLEYVRDLVRGQHAAVPDGAATAAVLAAAMVQRAAEATTGKADRAGLARGIWAARDRVTEELGRRATDLRTKEEISAVVAAAIFDRALAELLAEAFDKVGKDGVITVEPAAEPGLELTRSRAGESAAVADQVRQVRSQIDAAETPAERQELFTRLARLAGGTATVRVGAATSAETARLVARAERGLTIARLAMVHPVLPGGGAALADVQRALAKFPRSVPGGRSGDEAAGARIVLDSLSAPLRQLAQNAGVPAPTIDKALKSRKDGAGLDPATGATVPMRPHAVDILPVLQAAVANATALTIRVLTS